MLTNVFNIDFQYFIILFLPIKKQQNFPFIFGSHLKQHDLFTLKQLIYCVY